MKRMERTTCTILGCLLAVFAAVIIAGCSGKSSGPDIFPGALSSGGPASGQGAGDDQQQEQGDEQQGGQEDPLTVWKAAAAGYRHTLAILEEDQSLWAWGDNLYGQLGDSSSAGYSVSIPIPAGDPDDAWESVFAGGDCSFAIRSDGTLWAWGKNDSGQLGDGTTQDRHEPVLIGGMDERWVCVETGGYHTAAISEDGSLYLWGSNDFGQLGDNGVDSFRTSPARLGEDAWLAVSTGTFHTVAIRDDNTLWAWGYNSFGQLGDGTTEDRYEPVMIGSAGDEWTAVSAGWLHTAAIRSGELYGAGGNMCGQIAGQPYSPRLTFVRIGDQTGFVLVCAASHSTIALNDLGELWGIGNNIDGQLGLNGSFVNRNAFGQMGNDDDWASVSSTNRHTMFLKEDGSLYAAGYNDKGQAGDGTSGMDKWFLVLISIQ